MIALVTDSDFGSSNISIGKVSRTNLFFKIIDFIELEVVFMGDTKAISREEDGYLLVVTYL